jgi:hypothetical protein
MFDMSRFICRIRGHRPVHESPREFQQGRWRANFYLRCSRCGSSDYYKVTTPGFLQYYRNRRYYLHRLCTSIRLWWREECPDCKKPCVRFGKPAGHHDGCDTIPF